MTPKDNNDLSAENIGWLRAFENDHISDEELKAEVDAICGKNATKEPLEADSSEGTQSTPLQKALEEAVCFQDLEQTTFDDLLQEPPQKPKASRLSRHELEDQIDLPRSKGNGGWYKKSHRERE